jgi:hypothetical protein
MVLPVFVPQSYPDWWSTVDFGTLPFAPVVGVSALAALGLVLLRRRPTAKRLLVLGLAWPLLTILPLLGLRDPSHVFRLGFLVCFGAGLVVAAAATALDDHRDVLGAAGVLMVVALVPIARSSAAAWGPGGFQYQQTLRWVEADSAWRSKLTPEMQARLRKQIEAHLSPGDKLPQE